MRALLIVIENLGVGRAPDASGPHLPNTLGELFGALPELELPTLYSLGLGEILKGRVFDPPARACAASYGRMVQRSAGADFLSGLWEIAGAVPCCPFGTLTALPAEIPAALALETGLEFLVDPASLPELRREHLRTGSPILSLGADATLHLAAHDAVIPPARFAQICRAARRLCDTWHIARVEGRLFSGKPEAWKLASDPICLPIVPPRTILNAISEKGLPVEAVGAVNDAFARSGITRAHPTATAAQSLAVIERLWRSPLNGLVVANLHGGDHAHTLDAIDEWLEGFLGEIEPDNLFIITGSNGGHPAVFQPEPTRQEVPVLVRYGGHTAPLGIRESFADVAATLAAFFGIREGDRPWSVGEPLITFHHPRGLWGG